MNGRETRVFVLARSEQEITGQIYPALKQAGVAMPGYATNLDDLQVHLTWGPADYLLVHVNVSRRGEERALLEGLPGDLPLLVVLPRSRSNAAGEMAALPRVAQVAVEPVDYAALLATVARQSGSEVGPETRPQPGTEPATVPNAPSERTNRSSNVDQTALNVERPVRARRARLIAFASGMLGGTGKSTLAGTLAWLLADAGQARTLLLSLGTPPAALSHFKLARWPDLATFLSGEEKFARVVQRVGALHVALAPGDPVAYDRIGSVTRDEAGAVLRAVEQALARYDVVVADLPSDSSGWAVHPLLAADDVVLVVRSTVADQLGLVQALALLKGLRSRAHLVLNDRSGSDVDAAGFVAGVGQMVPCPEPVVVVPHNDAVVLAQNEALPLALAEGTDDVLDALRKLAAYLGYAFEVEEEAKAGQVQVATPSRDGKQPGKRKAFSLPGVQFKLTD